MFFQLFPKKYNRKHFINFLNPRWAIHSNSYQVLGFANLRVERIVYQGSQSNMKAQTIIEKNGTDTRRLRNNATYTQKLKMLKKKISFDILNSHWAKVFKTINDFLTYKIVFYSDFQTFANIIMLKTKVRNRNLSLNLAFKIKHFYFTHLY